MVKSQRIIPGTARNLLYNFLRELEAIGFLLARTRDEEAEKMKFVSLHCVEDGARHASRILTRALFPCRAAMGFGSNLPCRASAQEQADHAVVLERCRGIFAQHVQ